MKSNNQLFNSQTAPIPEIRRDLQIIPITDSGRDLLYFHDSMGYLTENFALDINVQPLLSLFTGKSSVDQILQQIDSDIKADELLQFVRLLDQHNVLYSDRFQEHSEAIENEFEESDTRQPALAGQSYPDEPEELDSFVSKILQHGSSNGRTNFNALYAPHIELSVGQKQYGEAFSHLKNIKPKRVIILATSHYADYYFRYYKGFPFIGSNKSYRLPGRTISADTEVLSDLGEKSPQNGFTLKDRAHRVEHSIEFHLLFASSIWSHDFEIVPILVKGFDELYYHQSGDMAKKIDRFTSQLKSYIDDDTFVLISGDLSHVGQKFGDRDPANTMRENVEETDKQFLDIAVSGRSDRLLQHVRKDYDATRICGFAPLYTYLKMFPDRKGDLLNYFWWDEKERNSAVSFGSISY